MMFRLATVEKANYYRIINKMSIYYTIYTELRPSILFPIVIL